MRNKILDELLQATDYISGETLSELCGISRTAIWKHIKVLQQEGYQIESQHGSGYKLIDKNDVLNERELLADLKKKHFAPLPEVHCYKEVTSTNAVAKELALNALNKNGIVVTAESQSAGKGRLGRPWASAAGAGLWCSIVIAPEMALTEASRFSFIAAVAITESIRQVTGLEVQIKWPNDIVYQGKKLCGILVEMVAEAEQVDFFILGFGINVNQSLQDFPKEIQEKATSLRIETGQSISRAKLLQSILYTLNMNLSVYKKQYFEPIKEKWCDYACLLGEDVVIMNHNKNFYEGELLGIDDDGALLLKSANGDVRRVLAGDVSLKNAKGGYC